MGTLLMSEPPVQRIPESASFEDMTDTVACPFCEDRGYSETGGDGDCPIVACYKGRISGYRHDESIRSCDGVQCRAVDAQLERLP